MHVYTFLKREREREKGIPSGGGGHLREIGRAQTTNIQNPARNPEYWKGFENGRGVIGLDILLVCDGNWAVGPCMRTLKHQPK